MRPETLSFYTPVPNARVYATVQSERGDVWGAPVPLDLVQRVRSIFETGRTPSVFSVSASRAAVSKTHLCGIEKLLGIARRGNLKCCNRKGRNNNKCKYTLTSLLPTPNSKLIDCARVDFSVLATLRPPGPGLLTVPRGLGAQRGS